MEGNEKTTNDTPDNNGSINYYPRDPGVRAAVEELAKAVLASNTYHRYDDANRKLSANPELKKRIDEYRREVFMVQAGRHGDIDEIKHLERRSDELHEDSLTDAFLNSEIAMCRIFQRINYMLIDKVGFDPGFTPENNDI